MRIAAVQIIGETAVPFRILWKLRVEEIDRHLVAGNAADRVPPSADVNGAAFDDNCYTSIDRLQHVLRHPPLRGFGLIAAFVDVLAEISFPMHQRDADDRRTEIRG